MVLDRHATIAVATAETAIGKALKWGAVIATVRRLF
jgi:hypothetical protein